MLMNPRSDVSKMYKARRCYQEGLYDIEHLLIFGFLHCLHSTDIAAINSLWSIANPSNEKFIKCQRLIEIARLLVYYSATLVLEIVSEEISSDYSLKSYAKSVHTAGQFYLDSIRVTDWIDRSAFIHALPPSKWFTTVKVRAFLCPYLARK